MASKVHFLRGLSTNLSSVPLRDGNIIFATDTKAVYIDQMVSGDVERCKIVEQSIRSNPTQVWNSEPGYVSEHNTIYIYEDKTPGLKIGDGTTYLIDLPFITSAIDDHIADETVHISQSEREFWNNKVTAYLSSDDTEVLILDKN